MFTLAKFRMLNAIGNELDIWPLIQQAEIASIYHFNSVATMHGKHNQHSTLSQGLVTE